MDTRLRSHGHLNVGVVGRGDGVRRLKMLERAASAMALETCVPSGSGPVLFVELCSTCIGVGTDGGSVCCTDILAVS